MVYVVEEGRGCFGLRPLLFPVAGEDAEERERGGGRGGGREGRREGEEEGGRG